MTMPDFNDFHKHTTLFDAKPDLESEDLDCFSEAIQGVKPNKQDKIGRNSTIRLTKNADKAYHREQATVDTSQISDGLSTESVDIVESDQALLFAAPGIQLNVIKRLKKGHIPWEQGIDLHGFSIDEARDQLSNFIRSCYYQGCQTVLVVHGKAYSQSGSLPLLKSYTNDWLRQLPEVLAFSSAQAKDGGAGALYVLLKRKK